MAERRAGRLPQESSGGATTRGLVVTLCGVALVLAACNGVLMVRSANSGSAMMTSQWRRLAALDQPVDWLLVGDSSGLMGIRPTVVEEVLGGECLNLCVPGWGLSLNDAWMVASHLERGVRPRNVVVVHGFVVLRRDFDLMTCQMMGHVPEPWGFWERWEPSRRLDLAQAWTVFENRCLPLYVEHTSVSSLLMDPGRIWRKLRRRIAVSPAAAATGSAAPVAASAPAPSLPTARDRAKGMCPAPEVDRELVHSELEHERTHPAPVPVTGLMLSGLDQIGDLADRHGFKVYLVNGPVPEPVFDEPGMDRYFAAVEAALQGVAARHRQVVYVPGFKVFPEDAMQNAVHVLPSSSEAYSRWVAEGIRRAQDEVSPGTSPAPPPAS